MQTDNYIAFGLSGSESRISMVGSDVTWTWMDNAGVHARGAQHKCLLSGKFGNKAISCIIKLS